jgi:hypothetical protein
MDALARDSRASTDQGQSNPPTNKEKRQKASFEPVIEATEKSNNLFCTRPIYQPDFGNSYWLIQYRPQGVHTDRHREN